MILAARRETEDPQALATVIHDDVLQSLGVAVLGVELARRLHQRSRYEQALDELTGIVEALGTALESSERLLPELRQYTPSSPLTAPRPSLMVVATVGPSASARPVAGPDEIVQTIAACAFQARRCRGAYDAGLGEESMQELRPLLQRLEFVTHAFRALMNELRDLAVLPVMQPRMPMRPALTALPSLARSA